MRVLKVQSQREKGALGIRNILVVIQVAASIFLAIGTLIIDRQLDLSRNSDIGYIKNDLLIIRNLPSFDPVSASFKEEFVKQAGMQSTS